MKRLVKVMTREEGEVDITPMLDVVFIMLIFFIVTASFVKESGISLKVPKQNAETTIESEPIVVIVTELGEVKIRERLISTAMVESMIIRLRAEDPNADIIVKVERGTKTGLIVQVVDGIRSANYRMPSVSMI